MICSLQKSWTMMINIETQLAIAVIQSHFQFAKVLGENCASIFFGGCSSEYAFEFLTCKTLFPKDFRNLNVLFVVRNPRFLCLPPEKITFQSLSKSQLLDSTFQWNQDISNHIFISPSIHSQNS